MILTKTQFELCLIMSFSDIHRILLTYKSAKILKHLLRIAYLLMKYHFRLQNIFKILITSADIFELVCACHARYIHSKLVPFFF